MKCCLRLCISIWCTESVLILLMRLCCCYDTQKTQSDDKGRAAEQQWPVTAQLLVFVYLFIFFNKFTEKIIA